MAEGGFTRDDLRAGVSAGVLTEAQAARLITIAEARAGVRASGEDEPFELFRGFAEVFVSVGLVLLVAGLAGLARFTGFGLFGFSAAICALLAVYFTNVRRMVLPSVVLVTGFALSVLGLIASFKTDDWGMSAPWQGFGTFEGATLIAALLLWYRFFRVPFTMFIVGLVGLGIVFSITTGLGADAEQFSDIFDLRAGSGLALGTLAFGVLAFVGAMIFDMRDPHRLGRRAASGFWLHLLAAPALVNTVALTFWNMQSATGYVLLTLALILIALLALVIDRRSFLTAGIAYLAALLAFVLDANDGDFAWVGILLILGILITVLGAFWTQIRASLMRALPAFPGKTRLPPYSE